MAALFPIFLKLESRRVVVVGAGCIAAQKLEGLLEAKADIVVIAPEAIEATRELAQSGRIAWTQAAFEPALLAGASLVIAATGDAEVNERVYRAAREQGVLCNAVDEPERCDFYYGSVVRRGDLQIAISTAGKSPALAQRIRRELEQQFDSGYAAWLEWLGAARERLFERRIEPERRKRTLHRIAGLAVYERFRSRQSRKTQGGEKQNG
jgi:siroheme synthase-like protein